MNKFSILSIAFVLLIITGLSSCDKEDGGGGSSSINGTFVLQKVEGEICEKAIGGEIEDPIRTFTIDFKSKTITDKYSLENHSYTEPLDLSEGYIRDFLEYYIFFPVRLEFKDDGTVLCSARTYDSELIDFMDDDEITLSAHYYIKKNVIEFVYFIGEPVTYKIISKSGSELRLEPTAETLKDYNDNLARDTREKAWGMTLWDEMNWTKAYYSKQ